MLPFGIAVAIGVLCFVLARKSLPAFVLVEDGVQYFQESSGHDRDVLEKTLPVYHVLGAKERRFDDGTSITVLTASLNQKPSGSSNLIEGVREISKTDPVLIRIDDVERILAADAPIEMDVYVVSPGLVNQFAGEGTDYAVIER